MFALCLIAYLFAAFFSFASDYCLVSPFHFSSFVCVSVVACACCLSVFVVVVVFQFSIFMLIRAFDVCWIDLCASFQQSHSFKSRCEQFLPIEAQRLLVQSGAFCHFAVTWLTKWLAGCLNGRLSCFVGSFVNSLYIC